MDDTTLLAKYQTQLETMLEIANEFYNLKTSLSKSEVKKLVKNVKHKRITDKQLQYVFNALIIPTIEYRAQVTILNGRECECIISSFRRA
ncbi:unnamed protein product [Rhizophagus irregularis]|nr:unnamed protein product [Rhizophagus irregularis]CAB4432320.1 unnamed protein product [Rhizophagus irregularis]